MEWKRGRISGGGESPPSPAELLEPPPGLAMHPPPGIGKDRVGRWIAL
jgi:hypothetical protein